MGRGLDGFFSASCRPSAVFKLHGGCLCPFRWRDSERETPLPIPNRAVKSLSADGTWRATSWESRSPPVFSRAALRGGSFFAQLEPRLGGDAVLHTGTVVQVVRSTGSEADRPPLAIADRLGLDAVLAERREVDHQVGRVKQPFSYVYELSHGREGMDGLGRNPFICRGSCSGRGAGYVPAHNSNHSGGPDAAWDRELRVLNLSPHHGSSRRIRRDLLRIRDVPGGDEDEPAEPAVRAPPAARPQPVLRDPGGAGGGRHGHLPGGPAELRLRRLLAPGDDHHPGGPLPGEHLLLHPHRPEAPADHPAGDRGCRGQGADPLGPAAHLSAPWASRGDRRIDHGDPADRGHLLHDDQARALTGGISRSSEHFSSTAPGPRARARAQPRSPTGCVRSWAGTSRLPFRCCRHPTTLTTPPGASALQRSSPSTTNRWSSLVIRWARRCSSSIWPRAGAQSRSPVSPCWRPRTGARATGRRSGPCRKGGRTRVRCSRRRTCSRAVR